MYKKLSRIKICDFVMNGIEMEMLEEEYIPC